jgi:hypothetical protein
MSRKRASGAPVRRQSCREAPARGDTGVAFLEALQRAEIFSVRAVRRERFSNEALRVCHHRALDRMLNWRSSLAHALPPTPGAADDGVAFGVLHFGSDGDYLLVVTGVKERARASAVRGARLGRTQLPLVASGFDRHR